MRFLIPTLAVFVAFPAWAGDWSGPAHVLYRGDFAVTYRARVADGYLIVEAKHAAGWHTYSMDNKRRAQEATGKKSPECELPTVIKVGGGLEQAGPWRQSKPKDLSQPEIHWYTWGFEETALFAAPVSSTGDDTAHVTINAQACNASSCQMVQNLVVTVPLEGGQTGAADVTLDELVKVKKDRTPATEE